MLYKMREFPMPGEKRMSGYFVPLTLQLDFDLGQDLQASRYSELKVPGGIPSSAYCSSSKVAVMESM